MCECRQQSFESRDTESLSSFDSEFATWARTEVEASDGEGDTEDSVANKGMTWRILQRMFRKATKITTSTALTALRMITLTGTP